MVRTLMSKILGASPPPLQLSFFSTRVMTVLENNGVQEIRGQMNENQSSKGVIQNCLLGYVRPAYRCVHRPGGMYTSHLLLHPTHGLGVKHSGFSKEIV